MSNNLISRRRMMKIGAGALLAAGYWPGALAAQDAAAGEFEFICVNDLHYIDQGCIPFFNRMVQKMKEAAPKAGLLLVAGDLCENGTTQQLGGMRDILRTVGLPTRAVIGNHDWTAQTDRRNFEELFPDSINYTFEHGGWQIVGLDSSQGLEWQNTAVQKPTLDWVDQNLGRLDKARPMIIMTHFPLGQGVRYAVQNADDLLDRFRGHNVRGIFNGHFHSLTERTRGDYLITTNRCCSFRRNNHDGTSEKGFFACRATGAGTIERRFVQVA